MPATTYLHIQGRDTDPLRVLELPATGVRVGRGAQCEVRLMDPGLADVQCIVRPRGSSWHVQPVGPPGLISVEGEAVDHLRPLPIGQPLQVGAYRLVLQPSEWGTFEAPIDVPQGFEPRRSVEPQDVARPREPARPSMSANDAEAERLRRWQARLEQRERWLSDRQEEKKWESRWKAAGEGLRARSAPAVAPSTPPPQVDIARTPTARPTARVAPRPAPPRPTPPPIPASRHAPEPAVLPQPVTPPADPIPIRLSLPAPTAEPSTTFELSASFEADLAAVLDVATEPEPVETPTIESIEPVEEEKEAIEAPEPVPIEPVVAARIEPSPRLRVEPKPSPVVAPEIPTRPITRREPAPEVPPPPPIREADRGEFPSARAIFASQGTRPTALATKRRKRGPVPTDAVEPGQWTLPVWLGWPPALVASACLVGAGLLLGVAWTKDNMDAGMAARAATRSEDAKPVPFDPTIRPATAWWRTTSGHLAYWAAAIELSPESPDRAADVAGLLDASVAATPIDRAARLAKASAPASDDPALRSRPIGLSRDAASWTVAARGLGQSGKKPAALRAYRRAIEMAATAEPGRLGAPAFDESPDVRRYRLPHEAMVGTVIQDMIVAGEWTAEEWREALPEIAVARLAAARLLREKSRPEAEAVVDLVLKDDVTEPVRADFRAEHHAARAEALAFRSEKDAAAASYRKAVELATDDPNRRRWRLGLAEVLASLGASGERAEMLEAAKGLDPNDEVTQKALEAQKIAGLK